MTNPSTATIKRLFALSGNQCAFPLCPLSLIDEKTGKVIGRICHIKARSVGGPRFDQNQTDDERHDFSNLLLLCPIHHDVIDSDTEAYTAERLAQMKSAHESKALEPIEISDQAAHDFVLLSFGTLTSTSVTSKNQMGGQTADRITNILLSTASGDDFHAQMEQRRYEHDVRVFHESDTILDEEALDRGLNLIGGDHSYRESFFLALSDFSRFFSRAQNQYLNSDLAALSQELSQVLHRLSSFLATHFFVYPEHRNFENTRYCLYPELNIDRAGRGGHDDLATYDRFAEELNQIVAEARQKYQTYRKNVKEGLFQ